MVHLIVGGWILILKGLRMMKFNMAKEEMLKIQDFKLIRMSLNICLFITLQILSMVLITQD